MVSVEERLINDILIGLHTEAQHYGVTLAAVPWVWEKGKENYDIFSRLFNDTQKWKTHLENPITYQLKQWNAGKDGPHYLNTILQRLYTRLFAIYHTTPITTSSLLGRWVQAEENEETFHGRIISYSQDTYNGKIRVLIDLEPGCVLPGRPYDYVVWISYDQICEERVTWRNMAYREIFYNDDLDKIVVGVYDETDQRISRIGYYGPIRLEDYPILLDPRRKIERGSYFWYTGDMKNTFVPVSSNNDWYVHERSTHKDIPLLHMISHHQWNMAAHIIAAHLDESWAKTQDKIAMITTFLINRPIEDIYTYVCEPHTLADLFQRNYTQQKHKEGNHENN